MDSKFSVRQEVGGWTFTFPPNMIDELIVPGQDTGDVADFYARQYAPRLRAVLRADAMREQLEEYGLGLGNDLKGWTHTELSAMFLFLAAGNARESGGLTGYIGD